MSLTTSERTEFRRNRYKAAVNADDGRRRREDNMVEIRKIKREENLQKKRREGLQDQIMPSFPNATVEKMLENLPAMVAGISSGDYESQIEATTQFRKLLSVDNNPPIEKVIRSGVVPRLVEFLRMGDFPQLQFEAAWALTNIASGTSENTKVVLEYNAVPVFVSLLRSPYDRLREQSIWALGNIAGDSTACRDLILSCGALEPLLEQLNESTQLSMLRNATWSLSNLCRGKPSPPSEQTRPALPTLQALIRCVDEEVLIDTCWALCYLSDGSNDRVQDVVESGIFPRVIELLMHPTPAVVVPALRIVGNIATGDDVQTQFIIDHQALPYLLNLITLGQTKGIKKEACWTISNITAGNKKQIQAVIEAGIVGPLVKLLQSAEFEVKKEAAWAISNASCGGSNDQIMFLVNQGCLKPLCELLLCPDPRVIAVCLDGLRNILKVGESDKCLGVIEGVNIYAQAIEEAEGLEKIEKLQVHDNADIYERAANILETYWSNDDEEMESSELEQHAIAAFGHAK